MSDSGYMDLLTQLDINKCAENIDTTFRSTKSNIWKEFIHRMNLMHYNN